VRRLHGNEVDLAVIGRPPRELDTRAEPFAAHPHAVVAGTAHRLAQVEEIPATALAGEGFVVREEGSGTRAAMEQHFREHALRPPAIMDMSSNETIKQAVIANMGLSFLSLHTLGLELELERGLLRVVHVEGLPLVRRGHGFNLHGRTLSPAAEAFRYFVLENAETFLARMFPADLLLARQPAAPSRRGSSAAAQGRHPLPRHRGPPRAPISGCAIRVALPIAPTCALGVDARPRVGDRFALDQETTRRPPRRHRG
jgi:hypothetical protein